MYCFFLIFGAWDLKHQFLYFDPPPNAPNHLAGSHGELIAVYLVVLIATFIAGRGRNRVDALLGRQKEKLA